MQAVLIFVKTIKRGYSTQQHFHSWHRSWYGGRAQGQPYAMDANQRDWAMNDFKVENDGLDSDRCLSRGVDLDNVYHVFSRDVSGKRIDIGWGAENCV